MMVEYALGYGCYRATLCCLAAKAILVQAALVGLRVGLLPSARHVV
jgi:hypothetical protein